MKRLLMRVTKCLILPPIEYSVFSISLILAKQWGETPFRPKIEAKYMEDSENHSMVFAISRMMTYSFEINHLLCLNKISGFNVIKIYTA